MTDTNESFAPNDEGSTAPSSSPRARLPLEFQASTQRQRKLSRSIRVYAAGLCAIAAIGIGLVCLVNGNTDAQIVSTPATTAGRNGTPKAYTLPKVQQPKNLKENPEHESLLRKLRDEFHEWTEHHGRDYGDEAEKDKRFHIWKENHFRCAPTVDFFLLLLNWHPHSNRYPHSNIPFPSLSFPFQDSGKE